MYQLPLNQPVDSGKAGKRVRTRFPVTRTVNYQEQIDNMNREDVYQLKKIELDTDKRLINKKRDTFYIGRNLSKAKELLPHGAFRFWIEKRYSHEIPYSTAFAYMKVYEKFRSKQHLAQRVPYHILMSLTTKSFPEHIFKLILENEEYCEQADVKIITEAFKLFNEGQIDLHDFDSIAKAQIELGIAIAQGDTEKRLATNFRETLSLGVFDLLSGIRKIRKRVQQMQFLFPPVEGSKQEDHLKHKITEIIQELYLLIEDISNRTGLFKPIIRKDPTLGKEWISNEGPDVTDVN